MPDSSPPTPPDTASVRLEKLQEIALPAAALALATSADGQRVYVACLDGKVFEVDWGAKEPRLLSQHESYASGVVLLPGERVLVSAGYDGRLVWHDLQEHRELRRVRAHDFWSWDLAASGDGRWVASVTGQYRAGGYRYEPAPEREPSVKLVDAQTGEIRRVWSHVPPVQSVTFTPDSQHVAAGNLMGEVRVWNVASGEEVARWKTDDFTSWGIIKSHHYLGGIFALRFTPDGASLLACGMGPMVDPMAGNGTQRWQRFDWRTGRKLDQTHDGESGQGLMEALAVHPAGGVFAMAGRLFQGQWNLALFDTATGRKLFSLDAKHRITDAAFVEVGSRLVLSKARGQERKDGRWSDFGILERYAVKLA